MSYIVHVDPPRCNIGRHKHLVPAFLEAIQCAVTLRLRTVAMDHRRIEPIADEFPGDSFRATFRACENQRLPFLH